MQTKSRLLFPFMNATASLTCSAARPWWHIAGWVNLSPFNSIWEIGFQCITQAVYCIRFRQEHNKPPRIFRWKHYPSRHPNCWVIRSISSLLYFPSGHRFCIGSTTGICGTKHRDLLLNQTPLSYSWSDTLHTLSIEIVHISIVLVNCVFMHNNLRWHKLLLRSKAAPNGERRIIDLVIKVHNSFYTVSERDIQSPSNSDLLIVQLALSLWCHKPEGKKEIKTGTVII